MCKKMEATQYGTVVSLFLFFFNIKNTTSCNFKSFKLKVRKTKYNVGISFIAKSQTWT